MEKVCVYDEKFRFGDVNNFSFSFDIAKHLSRVGYNVTLVCVADEYLITNDKVKVVPLRVLDNVLCEENFEVLLCNGNITNTLNIKCDSKYLINNFSSETMSLFDGFFYVTENQKNKLLGNGFLNIKKIEVFVNKELYDISYDIPKKNKMVWTSCDFNALFFFLKSVFPLIKKEIDDFEMEIVNLDGLDDNL